MKKLQKLSLFGAVAGALILTAALAPRANATLIVYFNFEDAPTGTQNFDPAADVVGAPDFNPGGGTQTSTLTWSGANDTTGFGLLGNRTSNDADTANPGSALVLNKTATNAGQHLDFTVNTTFLTNLSLTFQVDNNGNGFNSITLQYSINGNPTFTTVSTQPAPLGSSNLVTFAAGTIGTSDFLGNGTPQSTDFRLVFNSTNSSNGQNRQTAIDNIQLNANVVPEPSTYIGGLLGIGVFCWSQRRRLIRSLRLRRA
jgi:PEP-CTERM motif